MRWGRSWTHGFTGYRSQISALYLDPILPPQISNYTVKGLKWADSVFDITLTSGNTTITRRNGTRATTPLQIGARNARAGN